jgi:L-fuconolactonase
VIRLDAHQHYWCYDRARDTWMTDEMSQLRRDYLPPELEVHLAAHRFDGTVAVQADQSERETLFLLGLAEHYASMDRPLCGGPSTTPERILRVRAVPWRATHCAGRTG